MVARSRVFRLKLPIRFSRCRQVSLFPEFLCHCCHRHNERRTQVLVLVSHTKRLQLSAALRSQMGEPYVHTFEFVEGGVHSLAAPGEWPSYGGPYLWTLSVFLGQGLTGGW